MEVERAVRQHVIAMPNPLQVVATIILQLTVTNTRRLAAISTLQLAVNIQWSNLQAMAL